MPRTRSAATPPPRRSGTDRPRSVRQMTRRAAPPVKKEARPRKSVAPELVVVEERVPEAALDPKQRLILQHAAARAGRTPTAFEGFSVIAVVLTCGVIFGAWWFLSDLFAPKPIVLAPVSATLAETTSSSTVHFVPQSASSSTATSTERRLLLPLTPSSSTKRIP